MSCLLSFSIAVFLNDDVLVVYFCVYLLLGHVICPLHGVTTLG